MRSTDSLSALRAMCLDPDRLSADEAIVAALEEAGTGGWKRTAEETVTRLEAAIGEWMVTRAVHMTSEGTVSQAQAVMATVSEAIASG